MYGAVPPAASTTAVPSHVALQLTFVWLMMLDESPFGPIIVTVSEATHPFASVTVTV